MSDLRELASLAAEHVMEWRRGPLPVEGYDFTTGNAETWYKGGYVCSVRSWNPAENIADAWKLVEALSPTGEIGKEPPGWKQFRLTSLYDGYHASFFTVSGKDIYDSIALAPAKAITLAALKSKGIDVSKWEG